MTGPGLFLLAAPRSGSTQLARWLSTHPDIALGRVKEPNFFSAHEFDPADVRRRHLNDIDPARPVRRPAQFAVYRDEGLYRALYTGLRARWRLDASTSYLACPEAPVAIRHAIPDARAIVLTREPVARALSHYRLALRTGQTRAPLAHEIRRELSGALPLAARYLIRPSRQAEGVARVRAAFPPDHLLCLTYEDTFADPPATLARVAGFLCIDPAGFDLSVKARNAGVAPRFAGLNAALHRSGLKTRLRRHLPDVAKQALKPLWFDPGRTVAIPTADRAALEAALDLP